MKKCPVVFIAIKEYDNLGVCYLASALDEAGYVTKVIDFRNKKENIIKTIKRLNPAIVGFSVVYQYNIDRFTELIGFLREGGINCHFTAGGHYASLKYEELFKLIPWLDSIVRFEGEYTIIELAKCIYSGTDWRGIDSIAYKQKGKIIANPLRPLEKDLDNFPFPIRSPLADYAFDKKFATIIAGRGCVHDCSFCNLKEFYRPSNGPFKRIRKPGMVVAEMEYLFYRKNCSVFLFQDDDFPVKTDRGAEWIVDFCNELKQKQLIDKIIWKINCRPDEVEEESFAMMKSNGLFLVFLGIEDGTDDGLKRLNKHMNVSKSLKGINILKKLNIGFDYGFMLFQPQTTFKSLYENLDFLRVMCGDGFTPVTFLKLMPFYNTRVEKELISEGRIKGKPGYRDYDFLEESLNHYFDFITDCFMEWIRYPDGLVNMAKWARNSFLVYQRFFDSSQKAKELYKNFRKIISNSNLLFLDTMMELAVIFETKKYEKDKQRVLKTYREIISSKHKDYIKKIIENISKLKDLAVAQEILEFF
jgi:anaerobic magnesium-protoporphyrin IX monomethyl ester cyclase